jgi:hypothetical protein
MLILIEFLNIPKYNAKKCYTLSINKSSTKLYELNNHILQEVSENPYLKRPQMEHTYQQRMQES